VYPSQELTLASKKIDTTLPPQDYQAQQVIEPPLIPKHGTLKKLVPVTNNPNSNKHSWMPLGPCVHWKKQVGVRVVVHGNPMKMNSLSRQGQVQRKMDIFGALTRNIAESPSWRNMLHIHFAAGFALLCILWNLWCQHFIVMAWVWLAGLFGFREVVLTSRDVDFVGKSRE
jgi:hypothetical protein